MALKGKEKKIKNKTKNTRKRKIAPHAILSRKKLVSFLVTYGNKINNNKLHMIDIHNNCWPTKSMKLKINKNTNSKTKTKKHKRTGICLPHMVD